jgi:sulfur-carrier protein
MRSERRGSAADGVRRSVTAVRIPPVLRPQVGNEKQVDASGATVAEVLADLVARHPGLREQLLTADGSLHRFVNVYLNGQDVRYLDDLATPVGERDTVIILPAMAGGS